MITVDKDSNGNISIMEIPPPLASIIAMCIKMHHGSMPEKHKANATQITRQIDRLQEIDLINTNNLNHKKP